MMDPRESAVLKLFLLVFLVNTSMMRGSTAADSMTVEVTPPPHRKLCNESRLQWEVEVCGDDFKKDMDHVDPQYWCNLTHFISAFSTIRPPLLGERSCHLQKFSNDSAVVGCINNGEEAEYRTLSSSTWQRQKI
uniref:uncharacterized protein isoform X4 n=1 Tax=Semicossyphus pulcher TaxID=241346 RepID=UPI0037E748BF